jgi:hypothetical protein
VFKEAYKDNEAKIGKASKRVKSMLDFLLEHGGDTRKSIRGRLKDVENMLDKEI